MREALVSMVPASIMLPISERLTGGTMMPLTPTMACEPSTGPMVWPDASAEAASVSAQTNPEA